MNNDITNWPKALNWVFGAEGDYSNDADDAGGATRYGISLRYLKGKGTIGDINNDGDIDEQDIRELNRSSAATFYRADFWDKCRCGQMPFPLAVIIFDQAVNTGVRTAARMLQKHVGAKTDGVIGPNTLSKVLIKFNRNPTWFIASYLGKRSRYYHDISVKNPTLEKFINGWFNRLFELQQFIVENA